MATIDWADLLRRPLVRGIQNAMALLDYSRGVRTAFSALYPKSMVEEGFGFSLPGMPNRVDVGGRKNATFGTLVPLDRGWIPGEEAGTWPMQNAFDEREIVFAAASPAPPQISEVSSYQTFYKSGDVGAGAGRLAGKGAEAPGEALANYMGIADFSAYEAEKSAMNSGDRSELEARRFRAFPEELSGSGAHALTDWPEHPGSGPCEINIDQIIARLCRAVSEAALASAEGGSA